MDLIKLNPNLMSLEPVPVYMAGATEIPQPSNPSLDPNADAYVPPASDARVPNEQSGDVAPCDVTMDEGLSENQTGVSGVTRPTLSRDPPSSSPSDTTHKSRVDTTRIPLPPADSVPQSAGRSSMNPELVNLYRSSTIGSILLLLRVWYDGWHMLLFLCAKLQLFFTRVCRLNRTSAVYKLRL
mgnify:CR=1 FL=1